MDFTVSDDVRAIRDQVGRICDGFDDEYWRKKDKEAAFPFEFHKAMAQAGFLGITMPEEYGGTNLGVVAAANMMNTVAQSAGAYAACSTIHINLFGPHPIVLYGTEEQKQRWLPPLVQGTQQCCFGVTEPDAGLDTTRIKTFATKVPGGYRVNGRKIWTSTAQVAHKIMLVTRTAPRDDANPTAGITLFYTDLDRTKIEVQRIDKMGRAAVDSNAVFIDDYFIPDEDRVGEEGKGFRYLLHSLNPERILVASCCTGIGQRSLQIASQYAKDRVVFDRPIGQNQAIQHPLAQNWCDLESTWLMIMKAAWLYDNGLPCGAEANAARLLAGKAGYFATLQAVMTHGGMGYAKEYNVERYLREVTLGRLTPVSEQMVLSFIAEKVLGQPKSY